MIWWKKTPAPPPDASEIDAMWREAFGHHQGGRIDQAVKLYRLVLKDAPQHFDARHLLGVAALQQGRLDEARREIAAALQINPRDAAAHSNMGTVWLRLGDPEQARASYEEALKLRPGDPETNASMGAALLQLGQPAAAVPHFRKAMAQVGTPQLRNQLGAALLSAGDTSAAVREFRLLVRDHPGDAEARGNLALALDRSGDFAAAMAAYDEALRLAPDQFEAAANRAALLARLGRLPEARQAFEDLAKRAPDSAVVHANLGAVHRDMGELQSALTSLRRALKLKPDLTEPRLTLAGALLDAGDPATAQAEVDEVLAEHPDHAEALAMAGRLAFGRDELAAAESALQRAIERSPQLATAHYMLGVVKMAAGDSAQARRCIERADQLDPTNPQARWAAVMTRLPALPPSEEEAAASRKSFAAGLRELERWFTGERAASGFAAVGSTQPFYLAYQRGNHRDLLATYGRLCEQLMRQWPGQVTPPQPAATKGGGKLRLGIVSAHFAEHSVWTAIVRGWVQGLDPKRIELHFFDLQPGSDTREAHARAAAVLRAPAGLAEWVRRIQGSRLDALLYPEIGMDPMASRLAALRLVPLQLVSWGHPMTSGFPTIDAYLSADAMEPPDAQDQYTEKLVRLPGLGVCYEPLDVPQEAIDLKALGLSADRPLLLSPGTPYKYAPRDDALWVSVAQRLPQALLVFFASGPAQSREAFRQRLERAFTQQGVDFASHVRFLPVLSRPQFFALMRRATLFLDTVGFSGFNTVMQAVECALPVVTMEGDALRGRFGSGILRELGLDDCVAADAAAYVDIAARLVEDPRALEDAKERMRSRQSRVFGTSAPVRELESFLLQACGSVK